MTDHSRTRQWIDIHAAVMNRIELLDRLPAGANVDLGGSFEEFTDEDWARHDAEVAKARAAIQEQEHEEWRRQRWIDLERADFPRRAIAAAKSGDEESAAIRRVMAWDPKQENMLVLSGSPGCGKTVAATWWAAQQRMPPTFIRATTLAASSRYDRDTRAGWFRARAVVLDDLGTEYLDSKGSFLVDLDELLDVFYGNCKPMLITTNCTSESFKERYGARVVDRLRECGAWFSISEPSRRSKTKT